jgi:TolB-like protein/Flp pilus assembly protein TadD
MFAKESGFAESDAPGNPGILRANTAVKALPPKGRNQTIACLRYRIPRHRPIATAETRSIDCFTISSLPETMRYLKQRGVAYGYVTPVCVDVEWFTPVSEATVENPTPAAVRAQLQRILESPLFSNARRLSQFLQFVVARSIEGQAAEIKEYLIAVEVYNRNPSYDPKDDSIVRAEASRLRAKLREYYDTGGRNDPIRIELPKGSYNPVFRLNSASIAADPNRIPEPSPKAKLPSRWAAAAGGLLLAGLAIAGVWWALRGSGKVYSITVMPPANLGSDRAINTLGDILADEITGALMDSTEWKVVGRAPAVDQTGRDQMLTWLRQNLHADFVLTGSYRIGENSNVRLALQLVDLEDGRLVWTRAYHQRLTLLSQSEKEFVRAVVSEITEKTRNASPTRMARNPANAQARKYYAQARDFWSKYTEQDLEQSLKLFQQAIQADPRFAPAWGGLADANVQLMNKTDQPFATRLADARAAANKAIALDSSNSEAHAALGDILLFQDWSFQAAAQHLERAAELDPIRVFPHILYSQALTILGDFDGAQEAVEAARARLPPTPEVLFQQGSVYFLARKFDKLEALGRELVALEPNGALGHWLVGLSLERRGQIANAIAEFKDGLQQKPNDLRTLCALSHAYGLAGNSAQAFDTARRFIDLDGTQTGVKPRYCCAALTYIGLGQKDKAFEFLEKGRANRDGSFPFFPHDFRFDPLKGDPRFAALADSLRAATGN